MKNNQIVFSATIHVILIHQTNFLSSCLTIHNSSTHPNRNSTPVVLCPVASYCCPSVPHCQRKLFCCQLPVTMWGAPAKHCGPISFALCISSSDLVNRQSSWPPAPAPTICLSVSLSFTLFLFLHPALSAENPSKRMLLQVGRPNPICPSRTRHPLHIFLSVPYLLLLLHSIPFRVEFTLRILNYCVHIKIEQTLIIYLFKWSWAKLLQTASIYPPPSLPACSSLLPVLGVLADFKVLLRSI